MPHLVSPELAERQPAAPPPRRGGWESLGREFLVTFIGVLLALAVNSWWQERQERRAELETLREIRSDLRTDSADVAGNLATLHGELASVDAITTIIDQRRPYEPRLDTLFAELGGWVDHKRNAAGYATLKSRGVRLVTNDSLRRAIAQFYEATYGEEDQHDRVEATAVGRTEPRLHQYLRQPTFFRPAHPVNYAALASDAGFRALLDELSERFDLGMRFDQGIAQEVQRLSAAIDAELARRR